MELSKIKALSQKDTQNCLYLLSVIGQSNSVPLVFDRFSAHLKKITSSFHLSFFVEQSKAKALDFRLTFPYVHNYGLFIKYSTVNYIPPSMHILEEYLNENVNKFSVLNDEGQYLYFITIEDWGKLCLQSNEENFGFDDIECLKVICEKLSETIISLINKKTTYLNTPSHNSVHNPYPTLKFNQEGKLIYSNQAAKEILPHFEELDWVYSNLFEKCINNNETSSYEQVIEHKHYSITIKPIPDEKVVNVFAMDISSRKHVENKLKEEKEKAEYSAQQKMEFLSTMSHEIRTPMNSIIGSINLLIDTALNPYQAKKLEMMRFAADNLLRLINEILDFNKLEANKVSLEKIRFSLPDTVEHLFNMYADQAEKKNIGFQLDAKNLPIHFVEGDPTRLSQILLNLLSNGIKFTEKGAVTLSVNTNFQNDDMIVYQFKIKDSGIGISQDKIDSIFEAFTQAEDSTTRKFGGTGLGLSITKKLVDLLEGELTVESEENKGTTFTVNLPFKISGNQNAIKRKDNLKIVDGNLKGNKVLLVDDNEFNILIASEFLSRWEADIIVAKDGQEALDQMENHTDIDIILMDLQMPVLNGFEATEQIREKDNPYFKNIPIVALTADVASDEIKNITAKGFNDFASKPFEPETLLSKLITLIEKKSN